MAINTLIVGGNVATKQILAVQKVSRLRYDLTV